MRFMIIDTMRLSVLLVAEIENLTRTGPRTQLQKTSNLQTRFGDIFSGIGDIFGPKDG